MDRGDLFNVVDRINININTIVRQPRVADLDLRGN